MVSADTNESDGKSNKQTSTTANAEPGRVFPFLSLPPELRLMIYDCIFDTLPKPTTGATAKEIEPTASFQVCRAIRYETADAFNKWLQPRLDEITTAMKAACEVDNAAREAVRQQRTRREVVEPERSVAHDSHGVLSHLEMRCQDRVLLAGGYDMKRIGGASERFWVELGRLKREARSKSGKVARRC